LKVVFVKGGKRNFRGGAFALPEVYLDLTLIAYINIILHYLPLSFIITDYWIIDLFDQFVCT